MDNLTFIKWGGSLITDKDTPMTANYELILSLASQLSEIIKANPGHKFLLGHGSGSFGHSVAHQYQTRNGVCSDEDWRGFIEVRRAAHALNKIVAAALDEFQIQYMIFPPSVNFLAKNGKADTFFLEPIEIALNDNIIPIVFGDVVFDSTLGGTILSTEDVFYSLAQILKPKKILLAGLSAGVFADFPVNKERIPKITPQSIKNDLQTITQSGSIDVTGGMIEKVKIMLKLIEYLPKLEVSIFSGSKTGNIKIAFDGGDIGTRIVKE